jgi:uncharacterized protein YndB with AHSA1/START domain
MSEIRWKRNLTIDIDPDSRLVYSWDMTDWFGESADITDYELIAEAPLTVPYDARVGMIVSFKVAGAVEGERRGVTLRVTVDGPAIQQDDRTVYFRGRHQ